MELHKTSTDQVPMAGSRGSQQVTTLVRGGQTDGQLALLELTLVAGNEPPRHLHTDEDEIIYVLEGELTVYVGDAVHRAVAGTCLVLPKAVEHAYVVEGKASRLLTAFTPAGFEDYFYEGDVGATATDLEHLVARAARYGVIVTGSAGPDDYDS